MTAQLALLRLWTRRCQAPRCRLLRAAASQAAPAADAAPAAEAALPSFLSLGVSPSLVTQLESTGLSRPTAVQAVAIPALLSSKNAAIQAQTGSGKTLAYLLPFLTSCLAEEGDALRGLGRRRSDAVLGVVVAPSQELAIQIFRQAEALLGPAGRQYVAQAVGGANMRRQLDALKRNKPLLVVGTPGRLAELSLLGHLKTHHVRTLVLDEADELLDPAFSRHVARLEEHAGRAVFGGRQTVLVSATLAQKTLDAYAPWCASPQLARVQGGAAAAGEEQREAPPSLPPSLSHRFVVVTDSRLRVDVLRRAVHAMDAQRALVFLNFGRRLADAAAKLGARGMAVGALHGEMNKEERGRTLAAFRAGKLRCLLVTDLAARGLDVPECDAVFNLELPSDGVHYAHRAGRTARAGRSGTVVTLAEPREQFVLGKFERQLGLRAGTIAECKLGGGEMLDVSEVNSRILRGKEE